MKLIFIKIAIPTMCFIVLGILFLGIYILQPNNTAFFFTIYGFAAVLFYYLVIHYGNRIFVLLGLLFSLIILVILKPTTNIIINIRNINWFILIGVMVFIISHYEKRGYYKNSNGRVIISWLIGFICVYVTMTLMNIYVYQFYQLDERFGLFYYMKQAIKISCVLGVGIGLGNVITQSFGNNFIHK